MVVVELAAVALTLVAVYLTARQVIWCWPVAIVSVLLYAAVFFDVRLYADMGLQGLYLALAVYGWWAWLRGGEDHGELQVSRASLRLGFTLLWLGAASGAGLGFLLQRWTDASLPFMDATLSAFSVVGQWMQTRKLLQAWLLWIAVDVVYVGMFLYKQLYLTAGLYAVFLYLAVMGYRSWKRSMEQDSRLKIED
jgi:nicotinamide mononucleotide transporter